jgi:beta-xylosidase
MRVTQIASLLALASAGLAANSTYLNPVLPGWHSDPSCVRVNETFFCATSTFIAFPGLPIYASKDLINWKLISHVWSRESQLPGVSWGTVGQQDGMYAPTIRYHNGEFYVVCEYINSPTGLMGVLFKTADPFNESSWSDPVVFRPSKIDPDLFWEDDGKLHVATQTIILQELDPVTGKLSQPPINLWNGTGGVWPEGPHIYKKDGWYYLLIAEGGTALNHAVMMARARDIKGPYTPYAGNPVLTNRNSQEYYQTVGHADLFQDTAGNWWGMALATRSGPGYNEYPMGREAVLFPVTWEKDAWPILQPVRGRMSGWPLPARTRDLPGSGPFNGDPDVYDFNTTAPIPRNLMTWRVPKTGAITPTATGLQLIPSRNNLTGTPGSTKTPELSGQRGLSFIARRQTDTLFDFSVDLTGFSPNATNTEAGVTVFLTQLNHIDLGVVLYPAPATTGATAPHLSFRFRAQGPAGALPATQIVPVPAQWPAGGDLRLQVSARNASHYEFSARPVGGSEADRLVVGHAWVGVVSGGDGSFVGSLVGVYATCNGEGTGEECPGGEKAYFKRWRYDGRGQGVEYREIVLPGQI